MTPSCGLLALGAHRCGTSMLAGLLALHGAFMGQTLPPGRHNPKGYWEHIGINEANESMLAHLQISWDWPFALPPRWQERLAPFEDLRAQACAPLREHALWAVKDPRLCRLLPLWLPLFSQPGQKLRAIVVFRHPEGACRSLEKRNAMSRRRALALWLHHFVDALTHLRDLPWVAVDYERMLADPRRGMDVLADKLQFGGWPRTPSDEDLRGFVDPALRHHPPAPPQSGEWLETSCYAFYEELRTRHLQEPDAALTRHAEGLRAQIDEGRGLALELIHDVYAEIPRLRACKLSVELALARQNTE
jgi:hypothetical protein